MRAHFYRCGRKGPIEAGKMYLVSRENEAKRTEVIPTLDNLYYPICAGDVV